jgi:hypothetical protein
MADNCCKAKWRQDSIEVGEIYEEIGSYAGVGGYQDGTCA